MSHRKYRLSLILAIIFLIVFVSTSCRLDDNPSTPESPPQTPTGLSVTAVTENSISLSWNPSTGAASYQLFSDLAPTGLFPTEVYNGENTNATDTSLSTNTTYYYKVRSSNSAGPSELSEAISARTVFPKISHRSESGSFTLDMNLGSTPSDVYFVFTNPSSQPASSRPQVSALTGQQVPAVESKTLEVDIEVLISQWVVVLRGKPEIDEFNRRPPPFTRAAPFSRKLLPTPSAPLLDTVGDTYSFMNDSTSSLIPATCRLVASSINVATGNPRTLNVWVADECWEIGGSPAVPKKITQEMLDQMGTKFLVSALGNDIYDWVTNVYGEEWGTHSYSNLIAPDDNITILLYDIDGDRSTTGGVIGYFWAKDNYDTSTISCSNERVMFYLDAVMYATEDGPTWESTDFWPQALFSALAHEFQHMINFYQKTVLRTEGVGLDTWINEMLSLATEDFLSWYLQVSEPRGVSYDDGTAGSPNNSQGRLPLYNANNYVSLTTWLQNLESYSICYAFGAYLFRNFGGVKVLRDIMHNSETDYRSIEVALAQGGFTETFPQLLQKWGVANLLSDDIQAPASYIYNRGDFLVSSLSGTSYKIGSINLFNYKIGNLVGPTIYASSPVGSADPKSTSNLYYTAGLGITGIQSWQIDLPTGMKLTVVRK